MLIEENNNSSLSEWSGRDPPSWHSFLFLLISFCLCPEPCLSVCWTDSAALPMPVPPSKDRTRWPCLDRAVGQQGAAVFPQDLVKLPGKTFNKGEGEKRWQELFFLPLAFLGLGQPLNLQGHQKALKRGRTEEKSSPEGEHSPGHNWGTDRHVAEHMSRSQIWNTRISVSLGGTLDSEGRSSTELLAATPPPRNTTMLPLPRARKEKEKNGGDEFFP